MPPALDELEAEILATWNRETIEVYGDQLQALGDPRGEMIAIDLAIEDGGATPELTARRTELIDAWLGDTIPNGRVRCGFVDLDATGADPVGQIRHAFDGPASRFVRSVAIVGSPATIIDTASALTEEVRPSLTRLRILQWNERERATIIATQAQQLAAAVPHLRELAIEGRRVIADFAHPQLARLTLSGFDGIGSLLDDALALPVVATLDLALFGHLARREPAPPNDLFARIGGGMPELVELDLSRNRPGYLDPDRLGGDAPIATMVRSLAIAERLRTLRMPSSTSPVDLANLRVAFPSVAISR